MKLTKEFIEAVRALDRAFAEVEAVWDENHESSQDLLDAYPFESSFDEMAIVVGNWRDLIESYKADKIVIEHARPLSSHPGDAHLLVVLARVKNELVVWGYNKEFDGFFGGRYYALEHESEAIKCYKERV